MKRLILIVAALAWASTASAKHERNNQTCSDCHTIHASISHNYGDGNTWSGGSAGPTELGANGYANLLQRNGTNATCLGCHNGIDTDVYGAVDATQSYVNVRSGGGLNGAVPGLTADAGYDDYKGHTLGAMATPPGFNNAAAWPTGAGEEGLTCAKCHAVHGGALNAFRLLGGVADMGWTGVKYRADNPFVANYPTKNSATTFSEAFDVTVVPGAAGSSNKDSRNVIYGKGANGMNKYCAVCHGNFHGAANTLTGTNFTRHPTTGEERVASQWFVSGAQVGDATIGGVVRPVWTNATATNFEVGCLTCHKGHGNKHAFGLIWPGNQPVTASTNYEEGDGGVYQTLCATCHVQAQTTAYRAASGGSRPKAAGGWTPVDTFVNGVKP